MTEQNPLEVQSEHFPSWMAYGACNGMDPAIFFPSNSNGEVTAAKRICLEQCTVRDACLTWAMDHEERFGVWGGTSERERRRLRRTWRKRSAA